MTGLKRNRIWCLVLVTALVLLPGALLAQSISGVVINQSTWLNSTNSAPEDWYVVPDEGTVVDGQGRVTVALFLTDDLENRLDIQPLAPDNMIGLTNLADAAVINLQTNYSLGNALEEGTYRVVAWIDGNNNGAHDVGEPFGHENVRISGESPVNNVRVTIIEDSDSDTLEDWWEVHWFEDLAQTAEMDYDNDGLSNGDEYDLIYATYPTYVGTHVYVRPDWWDTDRDGLDDAWEVFYQLNAVSAVGNDGASGDPDSDGINNISEYVGPDAVGWRRDVNLDGIAEFTTSTDAMDPSQADSDWDGVSDFNEFLVDLTHPIHSMDSTNFVGRSLDMGAMPTNGVAVTDPTGQAFALGYGGGTVECWVYPQGDGDGVLMAFPGAEAAGLDHFRLSLEDFRPKLQILTGATVLNQVGGVGVSGSIQQLETNQWNHLAFVISPENKSLSIHLNGVLLISQKVLINLNHAGTPTICAGFDDGYLDELRIWNYPRPVSDIDYWSSRYYPSPGYVQMEAETQSGRDVDMYTYGKPFPLMLYLRFDDGGAAVENFAYLNYGLYPNANAYRITDAAMVAAVTTDQAVPMYGSDDGDGDGMPEWWVDLYNMEKYREYYTSAFGPSPVWCPDDASLLLGFQYYRSFVGYASVGNQTGWSEPGSTVFYMPKTRPDFYEGDNSSYTKHVYLFSQPRSCPLNVYTPGMTSTVVYVNGERVTTVGEEGDQTQQYDVAQYMNIGRNTVHVECKSTVARNSDLSSYPYSLSDYQAYSSLVPDEPLGCDENPYQFSIAKGKFDVELTCNGMPVIVRGDKTRGDPRAVWHIQLWSTYFESISQVPLPDQEFRSARTNPDYGVPLHAERDNNPLDPDSADDELDAVYEFIGQTNPRERDSNNNGVTDGDEDYDNDGLVNREEQRFGSSPWLADSDDDGIIDGMDVGDGHPATSLSPQRNQSLYFGGTSNDYISMPLEQRFALDKWSIEAWIRPALGATGGILAQRAVGNGSINYEVGLTASNYPYVRYVSVAGAEVIATGPDPVIADGSNWTHVAAAYYDRELNLFINGTNVVSQTGSSFPALYAGGPVTQRIGAGFDGYIDEWRLWDAELTEERIQDQLQEVLTGLEDDLVAYYRFDDNSSYQAGSPLVGTSANNGTNGALPDVAWQWGQVEDNVLRYGSDWWLQWTHAASFAGNVVYTNVHIMQGPPRLQVLIETDDAITAGAAWSFNGGASWNESGFVETRLSAGDYNISFKSIDGWIAPGALPLTLVRGQSTVVTGTYIQTASLTVIINNSSEVTEVAKWSIDGGINWYGSGQTVANLTPGTPGYDIIFADISEDVPGWDRPSTINVELEAGKLETIPASYTAIKGSLQISFSSTNSPSTASWRVSGNTNWWASGETVTNLAYGEHQIEYNEVPWWQAPENETISIERSTPVYTLAREWTKLPEPSTITVTIEPADAIADGAQWSVNNTWYDSGDTVVVNAGEHVVTYRTIDGWLKPTEVTLNAMNIAATATGTYYRVDIVGNADDHGFTTPWGVAATPRFVYVTDSGNNRVRVFDRVSEEWQTLGSAGTGTGQFRQPLGVSLAPNGDVWVADTGNHRVQRLSMATGTWTAYGSYGGNVGQFIAPYDVEVDAGGNVFVADYHNSRIQKRLPNGNWSVVVNGGTQDGRVRYPSGLALDASGNLYVSDYDPTGEGDAGRVQKFSNTGNFIDQVASSVTNNGALNQNMGLEIAADGSLLVANTFADEVITLGTNQTWSTVIRTGVVLKPRDVTVDRWGDTIVSDSGNNRILILPAEDSDGDGVPDALEGTYGTLPGTADSDGDGVDDGDELRMGFDPLNPAVFPTLRYPTGGVVLTDRTPTFTWLPVTGATWYRVWLSRNGNTYTTPWISGANAWTPSALPGGAYQWWVQGWGPSIGSAGWSSEATFSLNVSAPSVITQIGPAGAQTENNLTYRWQKDGDASHYRIYVSQNGVGQWLDRWYSLSGTGQADVLVNAHPLGSFSWWIRPWGPDGYGPWSSAMTFSTPNPAPSEPVLVTPIGLAPVNPPMFNWTADRADWYRLYVNGPGGNVIDQWMTTETFAPSSAFSSGAYTWWVGGWNSITRQVIWSDPGLFTVP